MKKTLIVAVGLLAVVAAAFYALNNYIYSEKQAPAEQSMPLGGTSWVWQQTELVNGGRLEPSTPGRFVITFAEDGNVVSTTDCNQLSGTFVQNGSTIAFGHFGMTKMFCQGSVETPYAEQLGQSTSFAVQGDTLYLSLAEDMGTMTFVRAK